MPPLVRWRRTAAGPGLAIDAPTVSSVCVFVPYGRLSAAEPSRAGNLSCNRGEMFRECLRRGPGGIDAR